jgi:hypothetical protein
LRRHRRIRLGERRLERVADRFELGPVVGHRSPPIVVTLY